MTKNKKEQKLANENLNDDVSLEQANANGDATGAMLPLDELDGAAPTILEPETKVGAVVLDQIIEWIEPVSFSMYAGSKPSVQDFIVLSIESLQKVTREHGFDLGMKNDLYYVFNGQYWVQIAKAEFRHFLEVVALKQKVPHTTGKIHTFVDKLEKQFASAARFPLPPEGSVPTINIQNGTLHFTPNGVELKPFNKEDGITYQLHYDYDPSAKAPMFHAFLDRVLPDAGSQKLVSQVFGYVFLPEMRLEKMAIFYGGGANGKSVLLNIFTGLVGEEQTCEYTLEGITKSDRTSDYQRASIAPFLLNISTEISTKIGVPMFKKMVSREPLPCRQIYGKPFIAKRYATSLFATNELPRDIEQTPAFFRRLLLVPFSVRIPEAEQNPDLAKTIIASELPGVMNFVISGVNSLLTEGKFDIPEVVRQTVEEFRLETDNVLGFLNENQFNPDPVENVELRELFDAYRTQCSSDGSKPVEKNMFSRRLRNMGYEVKKVGRDHRTVVYASRKALTEGTDQLG